MLTTQAHTLDAIFHMLMRMAMKSEYVSNVETYMKLALKAQNQTRTTLEAISRIQHPQTTFVKQANIAHNQQVNNEEVKEVPQKTPNQLLEATKYERLDNRAPAEAINSDQEMETVGEVHRPKDQQGQE